MDNMADGGDGRTFDWFKYLTSEAISDFMPAVEAGNNGVVEEGLWSNLVLGEGMERNWVVEEGMGRKGAESVVGAAGFNWVVEEGMGKKNGVVEGMAAGSNSQRSPSGLGEQGSVSNGNCSGFEFGVRESTMAQSAVEVRDKSGAERIPEGIWNNGVAEGMERNGVVGGMGKEGPELMIGAAGSNSQRSPSGLTEQGSVSNGNYSGFEFGMGESSMAVQVPQSTVKGRKKKKGAERKTGKRAPPRSQRKRSLSEPKEMASDGSSVAVDYSKFASHILKSVVGVEAPQVMARLGDKRGADRMGAALAGFKRKRQWAKDQKGAWWDKVNTPGYTDADFKRDFHISRSTFSALCDMLAPSVAKQDTPFRPAIPVPQRVAVCVYRLATGENLRDLADRFGIGVCTCQKIVLSVTAAINAVFQAGSVSALWPHGTGAMDAAAAEFQDLTGGVPGVIGAVYTTHVPVIQPKKHVVYYYNRRLTQRRNGKTSFSVTLQAAVDASGAFTDFCIGYPGATSDEQIFSMSSMSTAHAGEMVAQGKRLVAGTGYPLTDWTLVPYTHSDLTPPQQTFNEKVALARGVALDAFRRLKARWAILEHRAEKKLGNLSSVMAACCVLHNLCERSGDALGVELNGFELEDDEVVLDNPVRSGAAAQERDAIARNLDQHARAGGSMPY